MEDKLLEPVCSTNPIVYLDITIGLEYAGRFVIELRKDIVPKTAENFRALCTGEYGIGKSGKPLHYKGIRFHKVTRLYVAQSGDIVNNDGTGGESIYGPIFEDENFTLKHEFEGIVSMTNYGKPNTNNSQFVITMVECENLNGSNVVVGRVLRGMGILSEMESNSDDNGQPTKEIFVCDCGELTPDKDWGICEADDNEYKLPLYPRDWERKFDKFTSDELVYILTSIRNVGNKYFAETRYFEARRKYIKANRYYDLLRKGFDWPTRNQLTNINDDLKTLDNFSVLNNINLAAVELKLKEYEKAKYACSEAIRLDSLCSKAFYRRGQAHIALKNYDEAIQDLKQANRLMPQNKQVMNELNRAKQLLYEYNKMQKNALKNLFV